MNVVNDATRLLILKLFCRDSCIADIADITDCSTNTVRSYLARFGEALGDAHNTHVKGVKPSRLEVDELWSYVYVKRDSRLHKRDRNQSLGPRKRQPPSQRGEFYTWTAFDPDSKLLIAHKTGKRRYSAGLALMNDLRKRVVGCPMITTDAYPAYEGLIDHTFGLDVDHVILKKEIVPWRNPKTGERGTKSFKIEKYTRRYSSADLSSASTSHIERMNATIRNFNPRFTRQTYKFSKRFENHLLRVRHCRLLLQFRQTSSWPA